MKNLFYILIIGVLGFTASYLLDWKWFGVLCFVASVVIKVNPGRAFHISFLAGGLVNLGYILLLDATKVQDLVGSLFQIPSQLSPILIALIFGLICGLFGLAGSFFSNYRRT